jgi:type II secretory ATPase GspE/PulE/Tfp pilus assembly ATPase PilB-like protein
MLMVAAWGWCRPCPARSAVPPPVALAAAAAGPLTLLAQTDQWWPPYPATGRTHDIQRGPGGYFSLIKLALVVVVFLVWVRLVDWLNRDALTFARYTELQAVIWNPVAVVSFLAGLLAVFSIPQFLAGFPVYLLAAFLPWGIYLWQRRGRIPEEALTGRLFTEAVTTTAVPITIKAAGSGDRSQANLIRARQSPAWEGTCQLLHDALRNRVDQVLLDYTRESVSHRIQVDGLWHARPLLDRETGDAVLSALKTLANLNPAERRAVQRGVFQGSVGRDKVEYELTSQGVKTGERVLLKLIREARSDLELTELGMPADMQQQLMEKVAAAGMVIISAPPGQGLTSTWQAVLNSADRFTRDFVGVADQDDRETERENIELRRIDSREGQSPASVLPGMILKQPNAFVMSRIPDQATMDIMTQQAVHENRTVITRVQATSAAEAVLRLMQLSGDRGLFTRSVTAVTCQRLVRRLCESCRQAVPARPDAIRKMGGDPAVHKVLYRDYQLPPVEQRVDAQGKPVEMEPCAECNGIGFRGRTAIYELLLVDQAVRDVLLDSPQLDAVNKVARQRGNLTLLQQAWRAVLEGRTSLSEVQRVFQLKK